MNEGVRGLRRLASDFSDSIGRRLSRKQWEHREQLQDIVEEKRCFVRKVRWQIALMANVGFLLTFGIRCNFGVAKNRMINNFTDAYGYIHEKEFSWTTTELGMMESSFFYGYAASQIPAGLLAAKFAPNLLFGFGIALAGVLNVVTALTLQHHPFTDYAVMLCQVVQGMALGVTYPAMHGVWRHWAPPLERSRLATTTFTGSYLGVMLGLPASAYLVSHFHWSTPFYVFGVLGVCWAVAWVFVSARTPSEHRYISESERQFIVEKVGKVTLSNMTLSTVPWGSILGSTSTWAIIIANFCRSWTFFLLLGNQITYMKDVLHIDIRNSGLLSALPQIMMAITVLSSGQIADHLRSTGRMNTGPVRKMFNTLGFGGEAFFLLLLAFITNPTAAVVCLVLGTGFSGMTLAGFNVNHFDIAPRYAPILMGFSNGIGALAGVGGMVTEYLTHNNPSGWKVCFLLAMAVDVFGILFFLLFASGEVQDWAKEQEPEQSMQDIVRRISTMVRRVSTRMSSRKASKPKAAEPAFGMSMDTGLAQLRQRGGRTERGLRGLAAVVEPRALDDIREAAEASAAQDPPSPPPLSRSLQAPPPHQAPPPQTPPPVCLAPPPLPQRPNTPDRPPV